jgi:hypothetical protein
MKRVMLTLCILLGVVVVYQLALALCECLGFLNICTHCVTPQCPAQYGCYRSQTILWQGYCCCTHPDGGCCQYFCIKYQCDGGLVPICKYTAEVERRALTQSIILRCHDDGLCKL